MPSYTGQVSSSISGSIFASLNAPKLMPESLFSKALGNCSLASGFAFVVLNWLLTNKFVEHCLPFLIMPFHQKQS